MSKKRGLSLEEKRTKMLEFFHEKESVFHLKELEKTVPKSTGIILQSVKDVLKSLTDDGLVDSEKIGSSNYFWSFPSKASVTILSRFQELTDGLSAANDKSAKLTRSLDSHKAAVVPDEVAARSKAIELMNTTKKNRDTLAGELDKWKDFDPVRLAKRKRVLDDAQMATERWTDNIFAIRKHMKDSLEMDLKEVDKRFEIPEDFDYLEL